MVCGRESALFLEERRIFESLRSEPDRDAQSRVKATKSNF